MLSFVAGAIAGGFAVWKYRDSIREQVQGNARPFREKVDEALHTLQEKSEGLLDFTKDQLSSRIESARTKVRGSSASG
jgi:hypothetical protein